MIVLMVQNMNARGGSARDNRMPVVPRVFTHEGSWTDAESSSCADPTVAETVIFEVNVVEVEDRRTDCESIVVLSVSQKGDERLVSTPINNRWSV